MSMTPLVERDERTVAVENASYRWAYLVAYFALLVDMVYRSVFRHEAAWDLLAFVCALPATVMIYQIRQKVWTRSQTRVAVLSGLFGAIFGVAVVIVISLRS